MSLRLFRHFIELENLGLLKGSINAVSKDFFEFWAQKHHAIYRNENFWDVEVADKFEIVFDEEAFLIV